MISLKVRLRDILNIARDALSANHARCRFRFYIFTRHDNRQNGYWLVLGCMGDHQGRPSAPLIRRVKPSKYGALTNTLELDLGTDDCREFFEVTIAIIC